MKFIKVSRCIQCLYFGSDPDNAGGYFCDHSKGKNTPIKNEHKILDNCPLPDYDEPLEIKEFVTQKKLHKPEEGQHGDCWASCISTITGIPLEELPDVNDQKYKDKWSNFWVDMYMFLQDRGFELYCENISNFKGNGNYCIASGKSPRGDFNHAVVWRDGIVHDPHPDRTGIMTIDHFEIIEKIEPK